MYFKKFLIVAGALAAAANAFALDDLQALDDKCNSGDSRACYKIGTIYKNRIMLNHSSASQNSNSAISLSELQESCQLYDVNTCRTAGSRFAKEHI